MLINVTENNMKLYDFGIAIIAFVLAIGYVNYMANSQDEKEKTSISSK